MNIDDLLYSLTTASCPEAAALLARISDANAALRAVPKGRQHALQYGRSEAAHDYDGSYVGLSD